MGLPALLGFLSPRGRGCLIAEYRGEKTDSGTETCASASHLHVEIISAWLVVSLGFKPLDYCQTVTQLSNSPLRERDWIGLSDHDSMVFRFD